MHSPRPNASLPTVLPNVLLAVCDDWGYAASATGQSLSTPTFDALARDGVTFTRAFTAAPMCTPARGALLLSRWPWRLGSAFNMWSVLPEGAPPSVFELLSKKGRYRTGFQGKGWGPGGLLWSNERRQLTGPSYRSLRSFLDGRPAPPARTPWAYWLGEGQTHRTFGYMCYKCAHRNESAQHRDDWVRWGVPPWLPDVPTIRRDIHAHTLCIECFDRSVGEALSTLRSVGELEHTVVIMTSDHGVPFPRAKASLYDAGTSILTLTLTPTLTLTLTLTLIRTLTLAPLHDAGTRVGLVIRTGAHVAARWPGGVARARVVPSLVSTIDLAPTLLEIAGLPLPHEWDGESLLPLLKGAARPQANSVVGQQAGVQAGAQGARRPRSGSYVLSGLELANYENDRTGYPMRAIRTDRFLYIRNFEPLRLPSEEGAYFYGESGAYLKATKNSSAAGRRFYALNFGRRPAEELYDIRIDPHSLVNLAGKAAHEGDRASLSRLLTSELQRTGDPRIAGYGAAAFERPLDWFRARAKLNGILISKGRPPLTSTGASGRGRLPAREEVPTWIVEPSLAPTPRPAHATTLPRATAIPPATVVPPARTTLPPARPHASPARPKPPLAAGGAWG